MSNIVISESNLSQKEWDAFIETHSPWSFFQSFLWGEVQEKLGNEVSRLTIEDKELAGIAQVITVRAKRGIFLHLRHGPVFKSTEVFKKYWPELRDYLKEYAKKSGAAFVRISPMIEDTAENRNFLKNLNLRPSPVQAMDAETCWVLDLTSSEDDLLKNMRRTTRYLIRQAEKLGVDISLSNNMELFMNLYKQTAQRHHFVPHSGIREEYEVFSKNKKTLFLLGTHNDELLAGALILFSGHQAIYHHGASIPSKIPVPYLLQWKAILEAKKRDASIYNFWGIAPENKPDHPWQGITRFKKGFGGREMRFVHAHDLPFSPQYTISYTIETARRLWRGY